jgi:hypothetical protein
VIVFGEISAPVGAASVTAAVGIIGVLIGLWLNADRADRERRRALHARALEAALSYGEMPFRIRRRRHEPEARSSERVRLSENFSTVQAELATCQVLLSADGRRRVARAYDVLIASTRNVVGAEAHQAWNVEPIESDPEMNMGPLYERLAPFREEVEKFRIAMAWTTLPRRWQLLRWRSRPR